MLDEFFKALGAGLDLVALVNGADKKQLIERGCPDTMATELARLYRIYFSDSIYRGLQRKGVEHARRKRHSLTVLLAVEKIADKIKNKTDKWRVRNQLLRMRGEPSDMTRRGNVLVAELRAKEKRKRAKKTNPVAIKRFKDGTSQLKITGRALDINAMYDAVKSAEDPLQAVIDIFSGQGGIKTVLTPMVIVPLDELSTIVSGDGEDVVLKLTNGATMTGQEFLEAELGDFGFITIYHPVKGPINAFNARFATYKQRLMAWAENPTCAWDGCLKPAEECQIHHILPHSLGGETKPSNLVTCCAYHNGINDDDPSRPSTRGRLERGVGGVRRVWKPTFAFA